MPRLNELSDRIALFADEREWNQFHSPKNLSMALAVEASELLEHFQWLTEEQSKSLPPEKHTEVESELADVFIYLVRLADKLQVDLFTAADRKLDINEMKYPIDKSKGNAKKYKDFD
jgi:dCTP diphosphatase